MENNTTLKERILHIDYDDVNQYEIETIRKIIEQASEEEILLVSQLTEVKERAVRLCLKSLSNGTANSESNVKDFCRNFESHLSIADNREGEAREDWHRLMISFYQICFLADYWLRCNRVFLADHQQTSKHWARRFSKFDKKVESFLNERFVEGGIELKASGSLQGEIFEELLTLLGDTSKQSTDQQIDSLHSLAKRLVFQNIISQVVALAVDEFFDPGINSGKLKDFLDFYVDQTQTRNDGSLEEVVKIIPEGRGWPQFTNHDWDFEDHKRSIRPILQIIFKDDTLEEIELSYKLSIAVLTEDKYWRICKLLYYSFIHPENHQSTIRSMMMKTQSSLLIFQSQIGWSNFNSYSSS